MLIPDLPGHGGSPRLTPDRRWGVEAYVESIEPFLDEVGLTTPHVVGNSLGATIALELASRGRAASAVALAPIGFWSRPES